MRRGGRAAAAAAALRRFCCQGAAAVGVKCACTGGTGCPGGAPCGWEAPSLAPCARQRAPFGIARQLQRLRFAALHAVMSAHEAPVAGGGFAYNRSRRLQCEQASEPGAGASTHAAAVRCAANRRATKPLPLQRRRLCSLGGTPGAWWLALTLRQASPPGGPHHNQRHCGLQWRAVHGAARTARRTALFRRRRCPLPHSAPSAAPRCLPPPPHHLQPARRRAASPPKGAHQRRLEGTRRRRGAAMGAAAAAAVEGLKDSWGHEDLLGVQRTQLAWVDGVRRQSQGTTWRGCGRGRRRRGAGEQRQTAADPLPPTYLGSLLVVHSQRILRQLLLEVALERQGDEGGRDLL